MGSVHMHASMHAEGASRPSHVGSRFRDRRTIRAHMYFHWGWGASTAPNVQLAPSRSRWALWCPCIVRTCAGVVRTGVAPVHLRAVPISPGSPHLQLFPLCMWLSGKREPYAEFGLLHSAHAQQLRRATRCMGHARMHAGCASVGGWLMHVRVLQVMSLAVPPRLKAAVDGALAAHVAAPSDARALLRRLAATALVDRNRTASNLAAQLARHSGAPAGGGSLEEMTAYVRLMNRIVGTGGPQLVAAEVDTLMPHMVRPHGHPWSRCLGTPHLSAA